MHSHISEHVLNATSQFSLGFLDIAVSTALLTSCQSLAQHVNVQSALLFHTAGGRYPKPELNASHCPARSDQGMELHAMRCVGAWESVVQAEEVAYQEDCPMMLLRHCSALHYHLQDQPQLGFLARQGLVLSLEMTHCMDTQAKSSHGGLSAHQARCSSMHLRHCSARHCLLQTKALIRCQAPLT